MAADSKTTTDHDTIKHWAEERGGKPASVAGTGGGDDPGLLRIDFEDDEKDDKLETISWDDFFEKFEAQRLSFLYQDKTNDGGVSRFNKFVKRG
jgi:hypothetical protein